MQSITYNVGEDLMDAFILNLKDVSWWVSVVVVGLLISLLAAYVKTGVDTIFSRFSSAWKKRVEQSANKRLAQVSELIKNDRARISWAANINWLMLRAISYKLFALLIMTMLVSWPSGEYFGAVILTLGGMTILMLAMSIAHSNQAISLKKILDESEDNSGS